MKISAGSWVELASKSFKYTLKDKRKVFSLVIIILLPVIVNLWRTIPEGIYFPYYEELHYFVYTFSVAAIALLVGIAWFLTIPRRDFAMRIIVMVVIFFGSYITYDTLPITAYTPVWVDALIVFSVFVFVCIYLYYVYKNYIIHSVDYKALHDGIVHDLHHERFMNEISRIEGLIDMAEMQEPYKTLCQQEVSKLRESVEYIAEKYSDLT